MHINFREQLTLHINVPKVLFAEVGLSQSLPKIDEILNISNSFNTNKNSTGREASICWRRDETHYHVPVNI